jgi:hypothetical protein
VKVTSGEGHEVAVVRVEVRGNDADQLLIELLEIGRERRHDRLLGRATNADDACRLLDVWLKELANAMGRSQGAQ